VCKCACEFWGNLGEFLPPTYFKRTTLSDDDEEEEIKMKWPPPIPIPSALEDSQQFIDGTPESFICSITLRVMKEPALSVKSGRTYEREALQEWVSGRGTDPLNPSARMSVDDIAPNFAIRDLIEQHVKDSALRFLMMTSNERNDNSNDSNNNNNNSNNNTAAINNGVREEGNREDEDNEGDANTVDNTDAIITTTNVKRERFLFPRRRVVAIAPEFKVTSVEYPDPDKNEPRGKFFRFKMEDLTNIVGNWACVDTEAYKTQEIKGGAGASFVARRNGTEDGNKAVCVWGGPNGEGVGCWNPAGYAKENDWEVGDTVTLLNYSESYAMPPLTFPLSISEYKTHSQTGWNLPGEMIRFGNAGLVGHWWKELDVEFVLDKSNVGTRVCGVHTDVPYESLCFNVKALRSDGQWHDVPLSRNKVAWGRAFAEPIDDARSVRVTWPDTDLHKLPGSTYRSGGGLHANIVGCSTSIDVLSVSEDGSRFRFDTDAMAAAFGGDKNWPGSYVCHALRTGITRPVKFEKSSSSSSKKGVRFLFAKKKTSDDDDDDENENNPLGVGRFEKDANAGDWRVGDILLLEKKIAGEEDQPQKGSDAWLEINFPEPKKKTKMEYPTV